MDWTGLILGAAAMAAGGVLKGAIGAGAPIIAVPLLALLYDVPFAVAVFLLPNILGNIWQGWQYRAHFLSRRFLWRFAGLGAVGVFLGSLVLVWLPGEALLAGLAGFVFLYIGLRLARPDWVLSRELGEKLSGIAGLMGGFMQGAGGVSAPVSVTFLNAMRLERVEFIATIAVFFTVLGVIQLPTLWALGVFTPERALISLAAVVPLFGAMPLGAWLAQRFSRQVFDRAILILLAVIAIRLLWDAVF